MSTRRKFLFDSSAAIAAVTLFPFKSAGELSRQPGDLQSPAQLSYESFAGQLKTPFRVHLSHRQVVELKLLKARVTLPTPMLPGRRPPVDAGYEKFSLIFSGPKEVLLESAIHQFEHRHLGRFEMYIGQIGAPRTDSVRYEAVFNSPLAALARGTFI